MPTGAVGSGVAVVLGRITGSSSIETLVRVGIEKEHGLSPDSKMVVLHDFTPCVDDELEVKRGQIVNILYRENDWVYVIGEDLRQEGFIPFSYCTPYNTHLAEMAIKKKLPRERENTVKSIASGEHNDTSVSLLNNINNMNNDTTLSATNNNNSNNNKRIDLIEVEVNNNNNSSNNNNNSKITLKNAIADLTTSPLVLESECTPFHKEPNGRYIVLYTFIARDENDVSVERGEFITLLNRDDSDWFWIVRSDGQEGFIPSGFIYSADSVLQTQQRLLEPTMKKAATMTDSANTIVASSGGGGTLGLASINNAIDNGNLNSLRQPVVLSSNNIIGGSLQRHQQQPGSSVSSAIATAAQIPAEDLRYGTELVMLYDYKVKLHRLF